MAAPSYTTDLTDIDLADSNATYTNIGTGADATETDYFIQGTGCVSKPFNITAGGILHNDGANLTFATGEVFWLWTYFGAPNAILTEANGGMQAAVGPSTTAYNLWNIYGSDNYTYGGWKCYPVDIINVAADVTVGSPGTTRQYFGVYTRTSVGIGKGNPLGLDVMRKGRGEARYSGGDLANGYATFNGYEAVNSAQSARWGLCQYEDGSYRIQGLLVFGNGAVVDFRDSNKNLIINNTKKVLSDFNRFEVRQAGSNLSWTNINITALGTVARGNFAVIDNATVTKTGCAFTDMGTFTYLGNSTLDACIYRRCGLITQGSAIFDTCRITNSTSSPAMVSNVPNNISGCEFVSTGTGYAIEITTPGTYAFVSNTFIGYGANGTTNAAIYNNSGGLVTLNVSGTGNTPTYNNGAGATTSIVSGATVTFTGLPTGTDIVILTAGTTTVLVSVDQNSGTSYAYGYSGTPTVDVGFIKPGYVPFYIRNLALTTVDSSIPVSLTLDRTYV